MSEVADVHKLGVAVARFKEEAEEAIVAQVVVAQFVKLLARLPVEDHHAVVHRADDLRLPSPFTSAMQVVARRRSAPPASPTPASGAPAPARRRSTAASRARRPTRSSRRRAAIPSPAVGASPVAVQHGNRCPAAADVEHTRGRWSWNRRGRSSVADPSLPPAVTSTSPIQAAVCSRHGSRGVAFRSPFRGDRFDSSRSSRTASANRRRRRSAGPWAEPRTRQSPAPPRRQQTNNARVAGRNRPPTCCGSSIFSWCSYAAFPFSDTISRPRAKGEVPVSRRYPILPRRTRHRLKSRIAAGVTPIPRINPASHVGISV